MARDALVFLDTNVFLGVYERSSQATLDALAEIAGHKERLVTTDQVWSEFLRNRSKVLGRSLKDLRAPSAPELPVELFGKTLGARLLKALDTYEARIEDVREKLESMILQPERHDIVHRTTAKIFEPPGPHHLAREDEAYEALFAAAQRRNEVGDPPRKAGGVAVGDGLNWEWCLEVAAAEDQDLVFVTMDSDFGVLHRSEMLGNTLLLREFRKRVPRREVTFTPDLAPALEVLGVDPKIIHRGEGR